MSSPVGQLFGKYQILEPLGKGGMAEVYKAYQPGLNRHVAVKILHGHLASDDGFIDRFQREATAVARLRHPNIIRVYDYDSITAAASQPVYYMVMELIEGPTLKEELQRRQEKSSDRNGHTAPYTLKEIAYLLTALASGLDYAHAQGVVHRDLKPANIMFTLEGQVVITDFGLVRLLNNPSLTTTGLITGTPAYMSPEQAQGEDVDQRSDIYSLGIVLFELLIGETPFQGDTPFSILVKQASAAPLTFLDHPQIPENLRPLMTRMLAHDPDDRYSTAGEVARELRQILGLTLDELDRSYAGLLHLPGQSAVAPTLPKIRRQPAVCPYRGLFAFREEDTNFFFGREPFTEKLLTAVTQNNAGNIIPVIGPSGSGKSSVIFAGLLPHLRQTADWAIASFRPGVHPFNALAYSLLQLASPTLSEIDHLVETRRLASALEHGSKALTPIINRVHHHHPNTPHILLVIDQFEEIFTLCNNPEERQRFLDLLTTAHTHELRLVLSLRADFLSQALTHPSLAATIQDNPLILGSMTRPQLERAVEEPAKLQETEFEAGLVERILDDVGYEPGNLPLLEFALTSLWTLQENGRLTHAAYDRIGRVDGALARHADEVYGRLQPDEKRAARRIFTQLVQPGAGTDDTRRLATRDEIGPEAWPLVRQLADARLIVTNHDPEGKETAEVIHEALIRSWGRLRKWMEADRTFRQWQERLRASLHQWQDNEQDEEVLLRGSPLNEAESWLQQRHSDVGTAEREYIEAAVVARRKQQEAREASRQRIFAGLIIGLLIALALAAISIVQRNNARSAEEQALQQRDEARNSLSRQLAVQGGAAINTDLALGSLLSIAAYETADTFIARTNLLASLESNPRLISYLNGHPAGPRSLAFSPDGSLLATGGIDGEILLWNLATLEQLRPLEGLKDQVRSLAFQPEGDLLASASSQEGIYLWNFARGSRSGPLIPSGDRLDQVVLSIAFHPDGRLLASASASGIITLWDVVLKRPVATLKGHNRSVTDLDFSEDGRLLASSSLDGTAIIWDLNTMAPLHEPLDGHEGIVWAVAFHPDSTKLATGANDGRIIIWDVTLGQPTSLRLSGHTEWVTSLAYRPDGLKLVSGGRDGDVIVWDMVRRAEDVRIGHLAAHQDVIWDTRFNPDGSRIATVSEDGQLILWNAEEEPRIGPLAAPPLALHEDWVRGVAYNATGDQLISGSKDGALVTWDLTTSPPTGRAFYSGNPVNAVAYSSDGRFIATGGSNNSVVLWDAALRTPLGEPLRGHGDEIWALAFSPDSKLLASAGSDGTIRFWDVEGREAIGEGLIGHEGTVWALAFTRDGTRLASGGADSTIRLWDVAQQVAAAPPLTAHNSAVTTLAFSPDGKLLASAGEDRTILFWDAAALTAYTFESDAIPKPIAPPLVGHDRPINTLAFSPNSALLASGSTGKATNAGEVGGGDDIIILWDVPTRKPLGRPFQSRHNRVFTLAFSPDGRTLASGGWDGMVLLWDTDPVAWQRSACRRINRDFTPAEWERFMGGVSYRPLCTELVTMNTLEGH